MGRSEKEKAQIFCWSSGWNKLYVQQSKILCAPPIQERNSRALQGEKVPKGIINNLFFLFEIPEGKMMS